MPGHFRDEVELVTCATVFVRERVHSLHADVSHCIYTKPYAPFPAILYTMATIDLLGALAAGRADRHAPTSANAKAYMTGFMGYTDEQARILQRLFRHKLVHLAAPQAIIEDTGRVISWHYWHPPDADHLAIKPLPPGSNVEVRPELNLSWNIPCDHEFVLSIALLVHDVGESVEKTPDGYLAGLASDATLRRNFERAFETMYDPTQA
jgi:hypothetical protein